MIGNEIALARTCLLGPWHLGGGYGKPKMDEDVIVSNLPEPFPRAELSPIPDYMEGLQNFEDGVAHYLELCGLCCPARHVRSSAHD